MNTPRRGDLAIIVSIPRLAYIPSPGTVRAQLYLVHSVDEHGVVKSVKTDASAPVRQVKGIEFEELVVIDPTGLDAGAALLAAPFEGFDSLADAHQYLDMFRSA